MIPTERKFTEPSKGLKRQLHGPPDSLSMVSTPPIPGPELDDPPQAATTVPVAMIEANSRMRLIAVSRGRPSDRWVGKLPDHRADRQASRASATVRPFARRRTRRTTMPYAKPDVLISTEDVEKRLGDPEL